MDHVHTDPEITRVIIGPSRQGHDSKIQVSAETSDLIHQAARIQDRQEKIQFHKGRLAVHWGKAQEIYFEEMYGHTRKRQTRWVIQMVNRINTYNMELWSTRNQVAAESAKLHAQAEERSRLEKLIVEEFDKNLSTVFALSIRISSWTRLLRRSCSYPTKNDKLG